MGGAGSSEVRDESVKEFLSYTQIDVNSKCQNIIEDVKIGPGEDPGCSEIININQECYNDSNVMIDLALSKAVEENTDATSAAKGGVLGGGARTSTIKKSKTGMSTIFKARCLADATNIIKNVEIDRCAKIMIGQKANNYSQCVMGLLTDEYASTKNKIKNEAKAGNFTALFGMIAIIGIVILLIIKAIKT